MRYPKLSFILMLIGLVSACSDCNKNKIVLPDLSHIKDTVNFVYIHDTINKRDSNYVYEHFDEFKRNHFDFVTNMAGYMASGVTNDSIARLFYDSYFTNDMVAELYDSIRIRTLPKIDGEKEKIRIAWKILKDLMPEDSMTSVYFYTSIFENQIIPLNWNLGIALEFYLGKGFNAYPNNGQFPGYRVRCMSPEYLAADVVRGIVHYRTDTLLKGERFLDLMIAHGKKLYFERLLMPGVEDSVLMRYTTEQIKFCYDEEAQIWQYFLDPRINILYETNHEKTDDFFANGPFTNAWRVKEMAPPKFAAWTGLRIVEKYIKNYPNTTLKELLYLSPDEILKGSKYKPK